MNLLLLLSALLAALTGGTADARVPQSAVAVVIVAQPATLLGTRVDERLRPFRAPLSRREISAIVGASWAIVPGAPLFLSRRRE